MKSAILLSLLTFCLIACFGAPLPTGEVTPSHAPKVLFGRQSSARTCGKHVYSKQAQMHAFNQAKAHEGNPIKAKLGAKYPHQFDNREMITFYDCPGKVAPFREFPIRRDGTLFTAGKKQKKDRIVYKHTANGYEFCGVMTHQGAPTKSGFLECP